MKIIYIFTFAAVSYFLLKILKPFFIRNFLDKPNERSSHNNSKPSGGGIVFSGLTSISSVLILLVNGFSRISIIPIISIPLSLVGLIDDKYKLPAYIRFLVQIITATALTLNSDLVTFQGASKIIFICFLIILIVSLINFTNFMDGSDGLVASCMLLMIGNLVINLNFSLPLFVLLGTLLGFLIMNWHPSKIFMGDSGSTYLGAIFSGLLLQTNSWQEAFSYLLVGFPLFADSLICLIRRTIKRQMIFRPHRLHLYQRLIRSGWSHNKVATLYCSATFLIILISYFSNIYLTISIIMVEIFIACYLEKKISVKFNN